MKYRLTVESFEANPQYEEELRTWNTDRFLGRNVQFGFDDGNRGPQPVKVDRTLQIELTDEEWEKVKQAVLETFI